MTVSTVVASHGRTAPQPTTRVEVDRAPGRARCGLVAGHLAPRLVDADADGARVALVATSALLLGGDHVRIDVRVGRGAWLDVVETSGTVAYDAGGVGSSWTVTAVVEAGGALTWAGLPFVVAHGAHVVRRTELTLAAGARAVVREVLVLGRSGEVGGVLRTSTRVSVDGVALLAEDLDLGPRGRVPGVLGDHTVLDTVLSAGEPSDHVPPGGTDEAEGTARLDLEGPGVMARFVGADTHASRVEEAWAAWAVRARRRRPLTAWPT